MSRGCAFVAAAACALAAGCATLEAPFSGHLASEAPQLRACAEWFRMLDKRIDEAGVRDAQEARIAGFPYLRTNRLLASLRPLALADEQALRGLAERMQTLDLEARRNEMLNLPPAQLAELPDALEHTRLCGGLLRETDLAKPEVRRALLERAAVPDSYRTFDRFLGLYAFTKFAFAAGVRRYEAEMREAFERPLAVPAGAVLIRHAPPTGAPLTRGRVARILERARQNALGIPELAEPELAELLAAYAPSIEVVVAGDYDRFGALRWTREAVAPAVDGAQLAVYAQPAWTRYQERVLLQLVYTLWFPERPPRVEGDILAGTLDGIVWRVTLAPDGAPLIYDAMHPCGCYHLFFPTSRAQALPVARGGDGAEEWMFSPQSLPQVAEDERPVLRIASGTHYIERVTLVRGSDSLARYELRPYGELRSMQRLGPGRASAFGPDGLVRGTERPERFTFWPMGIASAGAMRQWGHHATAFVGRRHFDDADLFEKRFRFDLD